MSPGTAARGEIALGSVERSEGYKNGANTVIVQCDVGTLSAQATVILGS